MLLGCQGGRLGEPNQERRPWLRRFSRKDFPVIEKDDLGWTNQGGPRGAPWGAKSRKTTLAEAFFEEGPPRNRKRRPWLAAGRPYMGSQIRETRPWLRRFSRMELSPRGPAAEAPYRNLLIDIYIYIYIYIYIFNKKKTALEPSIASQIVRGERFFGRV